jgi:hypothetical protein
LAGRITAAAAGTPGGFEHVEFVGGEEELRARTDPLRTTDADETRDLTALCDRYFAGWRPD